MSENAMNVCGGGGGDAAKANQPVRVLVVDDHPDTLFVLSKMLRKVGFEVVTADGVASALDAARRHAWDVLVTDLKLQDGTGWDLLARLRADRGTFPAVALSGLAYPGDLERSRQAGFRAHFTKPLDFPTVLATVRQCAADAAAA